MVKFFQNRELAQILGINLAKWKRWSREFLPPDPLGGLQSGYARQYNLDDAFVVYLGGYLVSALKFSIPEAKQILSDLKEWMISHRFYYHYDHINGKNDSSDALDGPYRIHILLSKARPAETCRILYRIKRVIARESVKVNGESVVMEKTVEERIDMNTNSLQDNKIVDGSTKEWGARVLHITDLYYHFLEVLDMTWIVDGSGETG
jgi:hypothetical protein